MNNQVKKWIRKCNLVTSRRRVLLHAVPGPEVLVRGAGLELLEVLDVLVRVGGLEAQGFVLPVVPSPRASRPGEKLTDPRVTVPVVTRGGGRVGVNT